MSEFQDAIVCNSSFNLQSDITELCFEQFY